jgi:aryl-alcohol dehydrogenase-like predicted oxidoreductase
MERRTLGRTGLSVPVVGMGTWRTFDVTGAEEPARRAVTDAALEAGANLFDTSPMYGEAERVLADTLRDRRDDAIVADKVWTSSAADGRRQIDQALAWYGGRVDIYQIHNLVATSVHLPMLEELRDDGKLRVLGATHYAHSAFGELLALMRTGRIDQIQIPYNAADRAVEREILPAAAELGIGVLVMRPLGEGALVRREPGPRALERLRDYGIRTWAQALIKWILSDDRVHAVLPATTKPQRMRENAEAGSPPWFDEVAREYVAGLV